MSTNSTVSIEQADGTVQTIYVHWDGYIEGGVGEALQKLYSTPGQVQAIVDEGDHSCILPDGRIESYMDMREEYCPPTTSKSIFEAINDLGQGHNYFMRLNGKLTCQDINGRIREILL